MKCPRCAEDLTNPAERPVGSELQGPTRAADWLRRPAGETQHERGFQWWTEDMDVLDVRIDDDGCLVLTCAADASARVAFGPGSLRSFIGLLDALSSVAREQPVHTTSPGRRAALVETGECDMGDHSVDFVGYDTDDEAAEIKRLAGHKDYGAVTLVLVMDDREIKPLREWWGYCNERDYGGGVRV